MAFQGLGVQGPPCTCFLLPINLEALPGWSLSVGSGSLMTVCSCAPVSHLYPATHLPSVCEINVVFVWVIAASVALLHYILSWREGKRPTGLNLMPASWHLSHTHCLCSGQSCFLGGEEGCWAEGSSPEYLLKGARDSGYGPRCLCGGGGCPPSPTSSRFCLLTPDGPHLSGCTLRHPSSSIPVGLGAHSFASAYPSTIPCQ